MAVSLSKGQKIDLKKSSGEKLTQFCVGANWGAIEKKGMFGGVKKKSVDLDLGAALFDKDNNLLKVISYRNKKHPGFQLSDDDTTGDLDGDDGLDNEVLTIDTNKIQSNVDKVVFILNSFSNDDFATIPFASVRLYEGNEDRVDNVVATYNISSQKEYSGFVSMVLGKLYKRNGEWKFSALGEPTTDRKLDDTVKTVKAKYL